MFTVLTASRIEETEQLLLTGGDARILSDPVLARNKYSCAPRPEPEVAAFGSSTASTISVAGFAAADRLRSQIVARLDRMSTPDVYACELHRVRNELTQLCGLADMAGLETVFSSSGTDAHLIATQLVAGEGSSPPLVIMMEADETGKGVPSALNGRHFSSRTALGATFPEGAPIADAGAVEVAPVSIRTADGGPRPADIIDREVEELAATASKHGQRVLVMLLDQSKSGLIAPTPACVAALRDRMPGEVDVLVDACQFRLAPSTIRAYLEQGFMVAVTGSKFLTGPAFSGALFIPGELTPRLRRCRLPGALSAYSARAEWPGEWTATALLDNVANFGLLLRWEAALAELRAFRAVPEAEIRRFLGECAAAVSKRLADDPCFEPLPAPLLDRGPLSDPASWDCLPTIFSFALYRRTASGERRPLTGDETQEIYRLLQCDLSDAASPADRHPASGLRCQLGQPVTCGMRDGVALSALRICTSSRLVVEAMAAGGAATIIQRLMAALDKTAWLVSR